MKNKHTEKWLKLIGPFVLPGLAGISVVVALYFWSQSVKFESAYHEKSVRLTRLQDKREARLAMLEKAYAEQQSSLGNAREEVQVVINEFTKTVRELYHEKKLSSDLRRQLFSKADDDPANFMPELQSVSPSEVPTFFRNQDEPLDDWLGRVHFELLDLGNPPLPVAGAKKS